MKIGEELEVPGELVHLIASRSPANLAFFQDWVIKTRALGIDPAAMRAALVGFGWPAAFVDWVLLAAPEPRPAVAAVVKNPKTGAEMILIPEGEFLMGGTAAGERPIRRVFLDAYRIGKNPVTAGEFMAYCENRKIDSCKFARLRWGWIDDHPMVRVNWQEARDFCIWAGGDLPTEAQWEKAARGADGREYPWGNDVGPDAMPMQLEVIGRREVNFARGELPVWPQPLRRLGHGLQRVGVVPGLVRRRLCRPEHSQPHRSANRKFARDARRFVVLSQAAALPLCAPEAPRSMVSELRPRIPSCRPAVNSSPSRNRV